MTLNAIWAIIFTIAFIAITFLISGAGEGLDTLMAMSVVAR